MATRPQADAARAGQAAHARRQRHGVAGAALRPGVGHDKYQVDVPGAGRRGRAMEARAATGELRGRGAQDLRPGRGRARHRAGDAGRRRHPGLPDDPDARRGVPRGQHRARQAAPDDGGARVPAQRPHPPHHRRRPGDEVARRAQPQGDGEGHQDALLAARPRGPARPAGRDAQARLAAGLARPLDRPARRAGDRPVNRAARSDGAVRRPAAAAGDPAGAGDGRRCRLAVRTRGHRPVDDPAAPVRHQDPRRRIRRAAPRRTERASARSTSSSTAATSTSTAPGSPRARRPASAAR